MRKSRRLSALFGQPVLHLGTASACVFIGSVGVGTVLNLTGHDKLQDDFSKSILDEAAVIIVQESPLAEISSRRIS